MNRPEFDEFAALWQEEVPDAEELQRLELAAARARRQGRLLAFADLAWFILLAGGSLLAAFMSPGPTFTAIALVLLVATAWLTWKRRKFRQMSRTLDTADRQAFLASSLRNARADLRRVTLSMIAFPLLVPLALLLKVSWRTGGDVADPLRIFSDWVESARGVVTLLILTLVLGYMARSRFKIRRELRRLRELQSDYAAEREVEENPQSIP